MDLIRIAVAIYYQYLAGILRQGANHSVLARNDSCSGPLYRAGDDSSRGHYLGTNVVPLRFNPFKIAFPSIICDNDIIEKIE